MREKRKKIVTPPKPGMKEIIVFVLKDVCQEVKEIR